MALVVRRQEEDLGVGISRSMRLAALSEGAAMLAQAGNRVAAIALLREAIGLEPTDFVVHRRLAATLASAGDRIAACDEHARYIGIALERGDVRRAAIELCYARATLGNSTELRLAAARPVALEFVAQALTTGTVIVDASPAEVVPPTPPATPIERATGPIRGFAFQVDDQRAAVAARLAGLWLVALVAFVGIAVGLFR